MRFLEWLDEGKLRHDFHVRSFQRRLEKVGDLSTMMTKGNGFSPILHYFT